MRNYTRVPGVLLALAALAAAPLALLGLGLIAVWAVAIAAGALALSRWLPRTLALALAIGGFFAIELLLLLATPHWGVGSVLPNVAVWTALSLTCSLPAAVRPPARLIDGRSAWLALSGSASALILVASFAIIDAIPGGGRLAWAMNGDSVNAMGFARRMLVDGGIDQRSTPQPTPLPFAMSAANMEGGRAGLAHSSLLEHDVIRTAQVWIFVIVLAALLVGAIVARAVRTTSLRWGVTVTALSSSIVLAWYVIGVQFDFGFMNSAFAVALLLAAWLAYAAGDARPAAVLLALFASALGLLAVWSPLVICVAGLVVITVWREFRLLRRARPRDHIVPALAALAFLIYAALVTLPGFLQQSSALGGNGGFPPIGPGSIAVIAASTLLVSAMLAQAGDGRAAAGSLAILAGFALGIAYLLWQRRDADFGWGYYPAKFAWTISIMLIVIITAFTARLVKKAALTRRWRFVMTALAAAVIAALLWGPVPPRAQVALVTVLSPPDASEQAADIVFDLAGSENGKDLLWRTRIGDFWPNTWLLQIDQPDGSPVKIYSTVPELAPDQVCSVIGALGDEAIVHTSDVAARADLEAACPQAVYTLIEGEY